MGKKQLPDKQETSTVRHNGKKTRWKPGVSGNPKGRPVKAKCIPDILKRLGEENVQNDPLIPDSLKRKFAAYGDDANKLEALMQLVYIYALQGKNWAVEFIAERTEGKVTQPISGLPEVIKVGYDNDEWGAENAE